MNRGATTLIDHGDVIEWKRAPVLIRFGGRFRAIGMRAGQYIEFYPAIDLDARVETQIIAGRPPIAGGEFFIPLSQFRAPPVGAMSYQVRGDGSLLFLEENLP